MKPYGVPRVGNIEFPDMADAYNFALKPSKHRFPEKCGKARSNIKSTEKKASIRRRFARLARIENKRECAETY